jgi:membrane protein DedA with SNARE-associated domain
LFAVLEANVLIHHFPYLGFFILLILGTLGLPFPEDAILIMAGFFVANQTIKLMPAFLAIYSGLLLTDFILFSFGKRYGRRLVENKKFQKILTAGRLAKLQDKFERWGILVIFLGRHLLGLRAQILLVAGVMRMSWKKFLIADAISALVTITLWCGVGYLGGQSIQTLRKNIKGIELFVTLILLISIGIMIVIKYLKLKGKRECTSNAFSRS